MPSKGKILLAWSCNSETGRQHLCQMFITKATYFIHVIHSNLPKRGHCKYKDGDTASLTA